MSIITSLGNTISIDLEDEEIMNHIFDNTSCAKIIIRQINNDRLYDPFFKDKKDLVILDIGANIGLFTLYAQDSASKLISVEPTPSHQNIFEKICGKYENVELVKAALSDKNETVNFYTCNANSTQNSLIKGKGTAVGESPPDENKVTVRGVTLEALLNEYNIDHVDFCKIDIEGSEMIAITEETLKPVYDKIDRMFIEVHSTYSGADMKWEEHLIINRKKIEKILDSVGYKYEVLPSMYQGAGIAAKFTSDGARGRAESETTASGSTKGQLIETGFLDWQNLLWAPKSEKRGRERVGMYSDTLHVFKDSKTN